MGRTKPVAKRRRLENEEAQNDAIKTLLSMPQQQVEAAAALATRESCEHWPKIHDKKFPDWLDGLGVATTLPKDHFQALTSLHEHIKKKASIWTSWSGLEEDPRKRAFGFLPDSLGYKIDIRDKLDVSTPWAKDEEGKERIRNNRAMVILDSMPEGTKEAIEYVCDIFRDTVLPQDSPLCSYLQYSNLMAAQPNLHCGRELLPTHVDHPGKDGFGVVIVTISIVGSGTILLQDFKDQKKATMEVSQGQAYMLSGKARDACAHGVVASDGHRESLNLRFGLHDMTIEEDHPLTLSSDVLKNWELNTENKT